MFEDLDTALKEAINMVEKDSRKHVRVEITRTEDGYTVELKDPVRVPEHASLYYRNCGNTLVFESRKEKVKEELERVLMMPEYERTKRFQTPSTASRKRKVGPRDSVIRDVECP